jgi:hypothetical protein
MTASSEPVRTAPCTSGHIVTIEVLLLGVLALLPRVLWLEADPHIDELYHLLAAEGWLASGEPRIGAGLYERAYLFTQLIGWCLELLGHSLQAARLPAVFTGTAMVVLLFLWTRRVAGRSAGWIAALLLAFSPLAVELSQIARFYTLHAFAFLGAAMLAYAAVGVGPKLRTRLVLALAALACAGLALHLQMLTALGVLGLGLWLAGLMLLETAGRMRTLLAGGLVVAAVSLLALMIESGVLAEAWRQFRWTPLWAAEFKNRVHFYHLQLAGQYPVLWPLAGFIGIAAFGFRPRPAAFCAVIFGTAFVFRSFAGMKDERYLFYVLPFLFALFGIGIAGAFEALRPLVRDLAERARLAMGPHLPALPVRAGLIVAALVFMLSAGSAPALLAFDLARGVLPSGPGRITSDWWRAAAVLTEQSAAADVVVVSDELAAIAALGRADVLISGSRRSELAGASVADRDPRTGVHVIDDAAALNTLRRCKRSGLIVLSTRDLAHGWAVPEAVRRTIEDVAEPLPLDAAPELRAFVWQRDGSTDPACPLALAGVGQLRAEEPHP